MFPTVRNLLREIGGSSIERGHGWVLLRRLQRVLHGRKPVILGPWVSEVGFEVLYWIPFLHWVREAFEVDPARFVAVSRGGVQEWYRPLAGAYEEALDLLPVDEFRRLNAARVDGRGQKQWTASPLEETLVDRVRRKPEYREATVLHPSLMYWLFDPFRRGRLPPSFPLARLRHRRLEASPPPDGLPPKYAAVKFYGNNAFPRTPANRALADRIVATLAERGPVVLLDADPHLDDHSLFAGLAGPRVRHVGANVPASENLAFQARVVAAADLFVGTTGGFAWLAAMHGVDTLGLYSNPEPLQADLDIARRVFGRAPFGHLVAADAQALGVWDHLTGPLRAHDPALQVPEVRP